MTIHRDIALIAAAIGLILTALATPVGTNEAQAPVLALHPAD